MLSGGSIAGLYRIALFLGDIVTSSFSICLFKSCSIYKVCFFIIIIDVCQYNNLVIKHRKYCQRCKKNLLAICCKRVHSLVLACRFQILPTDIRINSRDVLSISILLSWGYSIIKGSFLSCTYWTPWTKYAWPKIFSAKWKYNPMQYLWHFQSGYITSN